MKYSMNDRYEYISNELLESDEKDPILLLNKLMKDEHINMHGPEHHYLDGACFATILKNNGFSIELKDVLDELSKRSQSMPGAMCGYWGVCGSCTSIGAVLSIIDKTGPLSNDAGYKNHMIVTSNIISRMSEIGGPRCCKRNAFISLSEGIKYAHDNYGLKIELSEIICDYSSRNIQCIKDRCPFHRTVKD